ncbi:MAG: TonB-dependent receptor [Bacteroidales bacterium]|nr:TonB-dependent receptor [Bacteroidales bacterium]
MFKKSGLLVLLLLVITSLLAQEVVDTTMGKKFDELFDMSFDELNDIKVVSASKKEQKISEAPAIITVITAMQIRERGYESLAEALRSVPGLSVWDDNLISSINIRGFNSIRGWSRTIKIMINGQPVSFRTGSVNFIDEELIPIRAVQRIEIIRGPGSALYGANAYLGVINIITKDPSSENGKSEILISTKAGAKLLTKQGGFKLGGADFYIGQKINEDLSFIATGSYMYADRSGLALPEPVPVKYDTTLGKSENDLDRPVSFFGKLSYKGFNVTGNFQRLDSYGEFTDFSILTHENRLSVNNWFVRGEYKKEFNEKINTKLFIAYSEGKPTDKDHLEVGYPFWIKRELDVKSVDAGIEGYYSLSKKNNIIIGVDYTKDDQQPQNNIYVYKDTLYEEYAHPDNVLKRKDFNNLGIYSQFIYYPVNKLGITLGVRYDLHNIYGDVFNSRIAVVYNVIENINLKLLHSTSFKPPTSRELYDVAGSSRGNPDLEPQYAKTHEISLEHVSEKLRISFNFFYNNIENVIELLTVTDTTYTKIYENISTIKIQGIETELYYGIKNFSGYVNFSYQNSINKDTDIKTALVPEITANLGLNYIPVEYLNINMENLFVGKRISPKKLGWEYVTNISDTLNYKVPYYFLTNLTISTRNIKLLDRKETIFSLSVRNLFDYEYIDPGYANKGIDIPHYGRIFIIKITQRF